MFGGDEDDDGRKDRRHLECLVFFFLPTRVFFFPGRLDLFGVGGYRHVADKAGIASRAVVELVFVSEKCFAYLGDRSEALYRWIWTSFHYLSEIKELNK